ncbi:MAG TPA: hypothetical protein VG326_01665 [Tepidisphaeraceae bacterium]|jgi:hypothetical protein|nr:hypothetical protein [Tepidisphaeraceae bacterium]
MDSTHAPPIQRPSPPRFSHASTASAGFLNDRRFLKIASIALVLIGALLRLRQYLARTSFWGDEAFIVRNIRLHSPMQLLGKLNWDQAAPPLFLWALKGISSVAGQGEYAMRSVSLTCSLLGLAVFAVLARRLLPGPAALFSVCLFCLARRLVEYAAEVKQYGGDATVAALLLLIALGWDGFSAQRRLMWAAAFSAIMVWFSHPVSIVFGGVSAALSISCLRSGRRATFIAFASNALFAASFIALYLASIRWQHTDYLFRYWRSAFPDWRHPSHFPGWLASRFYNFLQTPYRWAAPVFAAMIVLAAVRAIRRREIERWSACAAPIALAVVAACLRQYPFNGERLTLFLMPPLFLLVGAGAAEAWDILPKNLRVAWWAIPASLFATGLVQGIGRLIHPLYASNIRPAVRYVQAHRLAGDALLLTGERIGDFKQRPFNDRHQEALCYWPDPPPPLYTDIASLDEVHERRFWVLMTFDPVEQKKIGAGVDPRALQPFLADFRAIAVQKDCFLDERGGAAYLFER